jgi:DNA repair exonuclease SbcCD ATPase subunit
VAEKTDKAKWYSNLIYLITFLSLGAFYFLIIYLMRLPENYYKRIIEKFQKDFKGLKKTIEEDKDTNLSLQKQMENVQQELKVAKEKEEKAQELLTFLQEEVVQKEKNILGLREEKLHINSLLKNQEYLSQKLSLENEKLYKTMSNLGKDNEEFKTHNENHLTNLESILEDMKGTYAFLQGIEGNILKLQEDERRVSEANFDIKTQALNINKQLNHVYFKNNKLSEESMARSKEVIEKLELLLKQINVKAINLTIKTYKESDRDLNLKELSQDMNELKNHLDQMKNQMVTDSKDTHHNLSENSLLLEELLKINSAIKDSNESNILNIKNMTNELQNLSSEGKTTLDSLTEVLKSSHVIKESMENNRSLGSQALSDSKTLQEELIEFGNPTFSS